MRSTFRLKMLVVPPRHYVVIDNPISRGKDGQVEYDKFGQVKLRHGDSEVRFQQEPFALFPGEKITGGVQPLQVVSENSALRLRAKRDFVDRYAKDDQGRALKRRAGEEWLFSGLATYQPQSEEEVVLTIQATIIKPNQALKLRAREDCVDYQGKVRKAGEQWLVSREGAYLPGVNEIEIGVVNAIVLNPKMAIHVQAVTGFTDARGNERKAGEEWLVTREQFETYIPDVNENVIAHVPLTVLSHRQYCVIGDPHDEATNKCLLGEEKYLRGPATFFLKPGERFVTHPSNVYILSPTQALWVSAKESFVDHNGTKRNPGDKWLIYGPGEYWPPVQVQNVSETNAFLSIEPLNLHFFQPVQFVASMFLLLVLFILLLTYAPGAFTKAVAKKAAKSEL